MTTESKKALQLFYCYSRKDKELREELDIHLASLKRQQLITSWYDGAIGAGSEWEKEIDAYLKSAHIILLLVTPHFMASDYCYGVEMERALERHKAGTARVIPIILRPTYWQDAPFSSLQVLPTGAKPVILWTYRDEAFLSITVAIREAIMELRDFLKTKEEWLDEGEALYKLKRYEEAIVALDQAIRLDLNDAETYNSKGAALLNLKRYEEAISAFDHTIRLDSNDAIAYYNKGVALLNLKRYEEAITAFDHAIRLDPHFAIAYHNKGVALLNLKRYEEAKRFREQARLLGYKG